MRHVRGAIIRCPRLLRTSAATSNLLRQRRNIAPYGNLHRNVSTARVQRGQSLPTMSQGGASTPRTIKILMLHGYTQSGSLFHGKTRALEKSLPRFLPPNTDVQLHYVTGPRRVQPADIPGYLETYGHGDAANGTGAEAQAIPEPDAWAWWQAKGDKDPKYYDGLDEGLAKIADALKTKGPFDGVCGFSQGAGAAALVASLLEPGRQKAFAARQQAGLGGMPFPESFLASPSAQSEPQPSSAEEAPLVNPPLRFAICFSGFKISPNPLYYAFYDPHISTPILHVLGSLDTVVSAERSQLLIDVCARPDPKGAAATQGSTAAEKWVVFHPGGHFVPSSQKPVVGAVATFIRETIGWEDAGGTAGARTENNLLGSQDRTAPESEQAEDMKMPF